MQSNKSENNHIVHSNLDCSPVKMAFFRLIFSILTVLSGASVVESSFSKPDQGFFTIINPPLICPGEYTYIYALHTSGVEANEKITFDRDIFFTKDNIYTQSGVIENDDGDAEVGCYLRLKANPGNPRSIAGSYTAVFSSPGEPPISRNAFVRPYSSFLRTGRIYTITVYPKEVGSNFLSKPLNFGVNFRQGCRKYRWFQGKKRLRNTKARLGLSTIEGAAGIYSISRDSRRFKGWFVQIEIIVASCPITHYKAPGGCTMRGTSSYPKCVDFGGVPRDREDSCICPPFRFGDDCSMYDCDPAENPAPLVSERTSGVQCSSLPGGNDKCKGYLTCYGSTYGCKCSSGWYGAGCDNACPDGMWGPDCELNCPDHDPHCDPVCGPMDPVLIIGMGLDLGA